MNEIYTRLKDYKEYESRYKTDEIEILALVGQGASGAGKFNHSWIPSIDILAYVDVSNNDLFAKKTRLTWIISDERNKEKGCDFPYYFKDESIYKLKVRESKKEVPTDNPWFNKEFMVVDVISENLKEPRLEEILKEYKRPIIIEEEGLGEFELDKDLCFFEGEFNLFGENILAYFDVDLDHEDTWQKSFVVLKELISKIKEKDAEFKMFAARELTKLANDWAEDGVAEISEEAFVKRISISSISVNYKGHFTIFYDDDDMFYSHAVTVNGKNGIADSASIEG